MANKSEQLAAIKICNTHELLARFGDLKKTDIAVSFDGYGGGRSMRVHGSSVYSPSHKTNPDASWYDYGKKTFVGNRAESLPKAFAWASERYGIAIDDWVPDPTRTGRGSYVPRVVRDRALHALKPNVDMGQRQPGDDAG